MRHEYSVTLELETKQFVKIISYTDHFPRVVKFLIVTNVISGILIIVKVDPSSGSRDTRRH